MLGLIGASSCNEEERRLAFEIGQEIARSEAILLCGGGGGVMEAGCEGAKRAGGTTVGILAGTRRQSRPHSRLDIEIYTGMGQARNQIIVLSSAALIAVGGEWGTLSEIALANKYAVPVVLLHSWTLTAPAGRCAADLPTAATPREAVETALKLAATRD